MSANQFPEYVTPDAIPGYVRAATCEGDLSANTAIFVREDQQHHILVGDQECTGTSLRSDPCDYTNCKGSTVMGLTTSAGKLVIGNWHGARKNGTFAKKRVLEFEQAAEAILKMQPFKEQKFVMFGGDTNVRSIWPTKSELDLNLEVTPSQIMAEIGPDILGVEGWTVDQHLAGEVGFSEAVKQGLRTSPLRQANGWNTLCPTKTKSRVSERIQETKVWTGEYEEKWWGNKKKFVKKTESLPNVRCRTPSDQTSTGKSPEEYVDMTNPWGAKNNAPSWTERFFLSTNLYEHCGKLMKDSRNAQNDHDPVFIRCTL
jgi:hypothetical protein